MPSPTPSKPSAVLAGLLLLLSATPSRADDPAERAERAAARAEAAAERSEAAAARTEAAIGRLERLIDELSRQSEARTAPPRPRPR